MNRAAIFVAGVAATLAFGALWHGPLGAADRFVTRADKIARATLDYYEMPAVTASADTLANARARAYRAVDEIDYADGFHRRDIGWRELERTR